LGWRPSLHLDTEKLRAGARTCAPSAFDDQRIRTPDD